MADVSTEPLSLASDFPAATREDWLKLVEGVLKGRLFDTLISKTYDGLSIEPLYARAADAQPIAGRAPGAPWQLLQRIDLSDAAAANAEALHDLANGATGLSLVFPRAIGDYGFAVEPSADALARVLDGVHLDADIALELDLSPAANQVGNDLATIMKARGVTPWGASIRMGFDPLGAMAHSGRSTLPWKEIAPNFCGLIRELAAQGFKGPFAVADGRVIHAAGGSEAQELASALSVAIAYLRALENGGIDLETARRMIFFRLATDADQFLSTAKFRALRKLWARVEEACGLTPAPAFITAETAWRMMTQRDPHVNMLRTTVATFAAAVGGADAIAVLPFTAAIGLPDRFARRIARNTQLILAEESNLAKVADPAAGSGAFEGLTDQLCRAAWTLFQEIEGAGGAEAALKNELIQAKVAATRAERQKAVAHRTDPITGTSEFPHLSEMPIAVMEPSKLQPYPAQEPEKESSALCRMRLAEPFEALRASSDRIVERTGARPKILLANLGRPADFLARATFARNLFEAGGIEAVTNDGFTSEPEMVAAYRASGARLACLCASDDLYASQGAAMAAALKHAGADHLYLAGRPQELEAALRKAGVTTFVYAGCDALATLTAAHDILATGSPERRRQRP